MLGNYLSAISCPFASVEFRAKSAPTIVWVARSRGLPRSTNTVSCIASSLWHFQGYFDIARSLSHFSCRYFLKYPSLFFH